MLEPESPGSAVLELLDATRSMTSFTSSTSGRSTSITRRSLSRGPRNSGGRTEDSKENEGRLERASETAEENLAGWAVEREIWIGAGREDGL